MDAMDRLDLPDQLEEPAQLVHVDRMDDQVQLVCLDQLVSLEQQDLVVLLEAPDLLGLLGLLDLVVPQVTKHIYTFILIVTGFYSRCHWYCWTIWTSW
jgi:hypothetical protein